MPSCSGARQTLLLYKEAPLLGRVTCPSCCCSMDSSWEPPNNGTPGPFDGPQWPHQAPRAMYLAVAVLMGLVVASASVLNGLVIVVSIRHKKLRSPLNYILVNLAVANLLVTLCGSSVSLSNNISGFFVFGKRLCELEGFMVSLTGIVGLWSLAILALERYLVICRPLGDFRFQHQHAASGCAFTWGWSLLWTTPPLLGWSSYVPEGRGAAAGVGHDAAGGEGGDTHGGGHGGGLPHLLAALRHLCTGGGHQQGHRHPASPGIPALLLLQDGHGLQPHHLRLHEQTVSELPAGNAVLWLPPLGAGENLSSCPQSPGRCRGAEKQGDTIASCVTAATSCLHQCQLQDLPVPPTAAQKGSGCS
uniref:Uncharacterized protein n=1 Tax=Corvus moneduloides TaxID=1196302 RepID=A0A8C3F1U1_CORMO